MLIGLDVDVYGFATAPSFPCCSSPAERLDFQRFFYVEVLYAIVLFLSLGIASETKIQPESVPPWRRDCPRVTPLLKLNQTSQALPKTPGECPSTTTPIHIPHLIRQLIRLPQSPGVAPTGPRPAPHHRKVLTLGFPTLAPTEHHRVLIPNSGNGSKPSMRIDRDLSHARSSSARW